MTIKRRSSLTILGKEFSREKLVKPGYTELINFDESSGYPVQHRWVGLGYTLEVVDNDTLSIKREIESWSREPEPEPRIYAKETINEIPGHMIDMGDKDISFHWQPSKERK